MIRKFIFKLIVLFIVLLTTYYCINQNATALSIQNYFFNRFQDFTTLKSITITGNLLLSKKRILHFIDINKGEKLYYISVNRIRDELMKLDEIKDANVTINYSGTMKIVLFERKPFAIWWNKGSAWLLDEEGRKIIKIKNTEEYNNLVVVFGEQIDKNLKKFLDLVRRFSLYKEIISLHYISNRRWDVYSNNNIVIKLPEDNLSRAMNELEKILKNTKYKDKVDMIDLRLYPGKIFLRFKNKV